MAWDGLRLKTSSLLHTHTHTQRMCSAQYVACTVLYYTCRLCRFMFYTDAFCYGSMHKRTRKKKVTHVFTYCLFFSFFLPSRDQCPVTGMFLLYCAAVAGLCQFFNRFMCVHQQQRLGSSLSVPLSTKRCFRNKTQMIKTMIFKATGRVSSICRVS